MSSDSVLIAVDVGNSRIKLGRFERVALSQGAKGQGTLTPALSQGERGRGELPEPTATLDLPLVTTSREVDAQRLSVWCKSHVGGDAQWLVASVHREAADSLSRAVVELAAGAHAEWPLRRVTYRDVPLAIDLKEPQRVGIDRLLAALAADWLRAPGRAAIVVDLGSATTVDRLEASGTFAGGAILPGLAMSARVLYQQTDSLPLVDVTAIKEPPAPVGTSTVAAIESGLFWGAVGAVCELIDRLSVGLAQPPEVLVTGGGARRLAEQVAARCGGPVRHVPHLVLAGIALVDQVQPRSSEHRTTGGTP